LFIDQRYDSQGPSEEFFQQDARLQSDTDSLEVITWRLPLVQTDDAIRERLVVVAKNIYAKIRHRPAVATRPGLKFADYWMLAIRMSAIGLVITGISLGAMRTYISIGLSRVFGEDVDADLKLALLGFFNKSLDVLLVSSLEYMASFFITVWMAQTVAVGDRRGVKYSDFGLREELTKPWMTVSSFVTRWRRSSLS